MRLAHLAHLAVLDTGKKEMPSMAGFGKYVGFVGLYNTGRGEDDSFYILEHTN